MALGRWQATITDASGNVVPAASVEVRRETAGQPLASIYSDRDGASPLSNPTVSDGDGFVGFHAAGGAYQVKATLGGFERVWRYVAIGLAQESDADPVDGSDAGVLFNWNTGTSDADPGSGNIRANNASLASATFLYASKTGRSGNGVANFLLSLDDSTTTHKGYVVLTQVSNAVQFVYSVTAITDATNYVKVAVTALGASPPTFTSGNNISFQFYRTGDTGGTSITSAVVTSAQTSTSQTLANITALTFAIGASQTWLFRADIIGEASVSAGTPCFSVNGPASPSSVAFAVDRVPTEIYWTGRRNTVSRHTAYEQVNTDEQEDAGALTHATIWGRIANGTNAGTVALRFRRSGASGTATVHPGSILTAWQV